MILLSLSALTLFFVWLERQYPRPIVETLQKNQPLSERWCFNLGLYCLGFGLNRLAFPLFYSLWVITHPPLLTSENSSTWAVFAGFIAMDFLSYFSHRLHHTSGFLWKLHRVHHEDARLDVVTAFRSHPLQWLTLSTLELGLAILIRIPFQSVVLFGLLLPFFLIWHHASVDLPKKYEKFLSALFVTPTWHAFHHAGSHQKSNSHFGSIFSVWDRAFPKNNFALIPALGLLLVLSGCNEKNRKIEFDPVMQAEVQYGKELITHTSRYLGPHGSVMQIIKSRMTCQNCHLDAGTKPYGISLEAVHVRYPSYRAREGKVLTVADRINNCMERPMNGKPLPLESREIKAMQAYFYSLAQGRKVAEIQTGDQLNDIVRFPTRAADPQRGGQLFQKNCVSCHGQDGQGKLSDDQSEYVYPPLWGIESFQAGSNMNRITKMASFIKANMPLGATDQKPVLTDEESFDVAAFVLDDRIHQRTIGNPNNFPVLKEKPIDYDKGPYIDGKSEIEHKFGPFLPIIENLRSLNDPVSY